MPIAFEFTPDQEAFRAGVREFLEREVRPGVAALGAYETFTAATIRQMQAEG